MVKNSPTCPIPKKNKGVSKICQKVSKNRLLVKKGSTVMWTESISVLDLN